MTKITYFGNKSMIRVPRAIRNCSRNSYLILSLKLLFKLVEIVIFELQKVVKNLLSFDNPKNIVIRYSDINFNKIRLKCAVCNKFWSKLPNIQGCGTKYLF